MIRPVFETINVNIAFIDMMNKLNIDGRPFIQFVRFMDDILVLAPNRWSLRPATAAAMARYRMSVLGLLNGHQNRGSRLPFMTHNRHSDGRSAASFLPILGLHMLYGDY